MPSFPAIRDPDQGANERIVKAQVRSEFESGYVQSRVKHSKARRQWDLSWERMSASDFALLDAFFVANQGGTFDWTHPETAVTYTVRFSGDYIDSTIQTRSQRDVRLQIEEV